MAAQIVPIKEEPREDDPMGKYRHDSPRRQYAYSNESSVEDRSYSPQMHRYALFDTLDS